MTTASNSGLVSVRASRRTACTVSIYPPSSPRTREVASAMLPHPVRNVSAIPLRGTPLYLAFAPYRTSRGTNAQTALAARPGNIDLESRLDSENGAQGRPATSPQYQSLTARGLQT